MKSYWIITTEYPPLYGGGIGTYCYQTAQMLRKQGWVVTVFVPGKNARRDHIIEQDGIRIVAFSINRTKGWNFLGYDTALAFEFAAVIKDYLHVEGVPDVFESQEYAGIAYFILQYKHLGYPLFTALRVLLTLHAPSFLYYDYNKVPAYQLPYFWIGEMERWCIKAADVLNAPSCFMTEAIQPYFTSGLNRDIHVMPYPFEHSGKHISLDNDPRRNWFFFGKLTPQKGIVQLLRAYRNLWQNGWSHPLVLIGGGEHYYHPENMSVTHWIRKNYAPELTSKKLVLLGNIPPETWQQVTGSGGIVIIPSIGDNYPFTVLESLASGQIVLASMQGGQRELIVHGKNGFLFDHKKKGDLEAKIIEIANLPINAIQKVRQEAMQTVPQYHSYARVYSLKDALLKKLAAGSHNNPVFPFTRTLGTPDIGKNVMGVAALLSVVIPFYNMGRYLEDTLLSIAQSSYKNIEIIVVDDGSTEPASLQALDRLQQQYKFRIVKQQNGGLAEARNTGVKSARGEYLAFVDADDKVHESYYGKAVSVLSQKDNVFFVGCWVQYFENSQGIWPAFTPEPPYLCYYNMVCSGGLVYKKVCFEQDGWNDAALEYGLEDWDSVISLVKNGWRGVVLPEPYYFYRIRKGSMARRFTTEKLLFSLRYIAEKHNSLYSNFAQELTALLNANGPGFKIDNPTLDYKSYGLLPEGLPFLKTIIKTVKRVPVLKKLAFKIYAALKK
jgi:glycosyltransferase involved in cell wall biosynthesis